MRISFVINYGLNFETAPASRVLCLAKELARHFDINVMGLQSGCNEKVDKVKLIIYI